MWRMYFQSKPIAQWTLELLDELKGTGVISIKDDVIHNV